jgi:hypothetical protein
VLTTYIIALMMEAASISATSTNFYQTTRRNNPEDSHLHTRRRENLKSNFNFVSRRSVCKKCCYQEVNVTLCNKASFKSRITFVHLKLLA